MNSVGKLHRMNLLVSFRTLDMIKYLIADLKFKSMVLHKASILSVCILGTADRICIVALDTLFKKFKAVPLIL